MIASVFEVLARLWGTNSYYFAGSSLGSNTTWRRFTHHVSQLCYSFFEVLLVFRGVNRFSRTRRRVALRLFLLLILVYHTHDWWYYVLYMYYTVYTIIRGF